MFKNKSINTIFILSIFLFSIKWILSFYFFKENLSVRIIFESTSDGYYNYTLIKYLAFFELNNSFDPYIKNLKMMPIPFTSVVFHSIFFKIFNFTGIIIVELIAIFFFLFIFYKIFSHFFSENESILISLFFFIIPTLIKITNLESFAYLSSFQQDFYSLRVPRPLVSSLYFFSFIYLLVLMDCTIIFEKKRFAALGLILGFSLSSFYYFFVIEFLVFFIFLIYKLKSKVIRELLKNYQYILIALFVFFISVLPFIINLIYHETNITERMGTFDLTIEKKLQLLNYYLSQYFKLKFLFILFLSVFCFYFVNKKKINNFKLINIFFIIFLGTIVSPIFFVLIATKSGLLYHFNNAVITWTIIFFTVLLIVLIKNYLKLNLKLLSTNILILLFICIYYLNFYFEKNEKFNNQTYKDRRIEFQKIIKNINNSKNIYNKNISLLTFDNELMIWSILNGIEYLNLSHALLTPKTHDMIENDLIQNFKFLNLEEKDFMNFLKNKKSGWRYLNTNVHSFFVLRYTANSLNTYKGSKNFESEIKKFILSSSPTYSQQIAIPIEEFNRLQKKFIEYETNKFNEPEFIVLEKSRPITKKIVIKKENYCKSYDGNTYILYLRKNYKIKCN